MMRIPAWRAMWAAACLAGGVAVLAAALLARSRQPQPEVSTAQPEADTRAKPPPSPAPASGPIVLEDVSAGTGIAFVHNHGGSGTRYIMETMSAGLALFDYDGDGLIDVYFLNGRPLPGTTSDVALKNRLYRNLGGFRFADVTDRAGVGDAGFGLGVAVGDYDNDGWPDVYVNNFGRNVLYHNNGDGTFTDVTEKAGVGVGEHVGAGACFLDIDGDGNLDLYVGRYIKFSFDKHVVRSVGGLPRYPGPRDFQPDADTLFRNNGDGTFTDVSVASGIAAHAGTSMGMVAFDFDGDGHTDVFICNDCRGNFLFHNDGTGQFKEVALAVGVGYDCFGAEHANMGAACGDYDNDGWLDLLVTSYQSEIPSLFRNLGNGLFQDVAQECIPPASLLPYVNWGVGLVDFDNDGRRDAYIANGHVQDNIELVDRSTSFRARNVLLWNDGKGKFLDVSAAGGDGMQIKKASRGTGFDDLDNDGRVDVVVLNLADAPDVLRNVSPAKNHWLQLKLVGVKTNRDGVGAKVKVVAGDLTLVDEVHSGHGYQSHFGSRLYFGLGRHDRVDRIEVRWIGGGVDVIENVSADRLLVITESHVAGVYRNPTLLAHYPAGIRFALGDLPAEATPPQR